MKNKIDIDLKGDTLTVICDNHDILFYLYKTLKDGFVEICDSFSETYEKD